MTPPCAGAAFRGEDWWFSADPDEQAWAKAKCADCPIGPECLAGALDRGEQHGIWFGLDLGVVELAEPVAWSLPEIAAPVHGERKTYLDGCHCEACTKANSVAIAEYRRLQKLRPPKPKRRHKHEGQFDLLATAAVTTPDWISI